MEDLVRQELSQNLKDITSIHSTDFDDTSLSKEMRDLLEDYEKFKDEIRRGLHGLKARYWFTYIGLTSVHIHRFDIGSHTSV